jgi:hypothetical protein
MIEEFIAKLCASCGKQFKPKAAQHKMCDGSSKKSGVSSSSGPPSKKGKSGAVHMITTQSDSFGDEGPTEYPSKKT